MARLTDDPKLALNVALLLEQIMPAIQEAVNSSNDRYPDDDKGAADWVNGAIYGACATVLHLNTPERSAHALTMLYNSVAEIIGDSIDRYGGPDLNRYAEDVLANLPTDVREEVAHA